MSSIVKEDLSIFFSEIEDPRIHRNKLYPIEEIVFLALVGALRGFESWRSLEIIGENSLELLRRFYPYENGIPSH